MENNKNKKVSNKVVECAEESVNQENETLFVLLERMKNNNEDY